MNMPTLSLRGASRARKLNTVTAGVLALALVASLIPITASAQPPSRFGPNRDVHVAITDPHAGPRFFIGPNHEDFHFVRPLPERHLIDSRDSLRNLLLRPLANAVAWGIGDIVTVELANALGLPVNTTLYGVAPGVQVVSTLPPGYFVAEAVPANVALVTAGPAETVVVCRRVPPGAFIAYQTSPTGVVLNECVVVPPVQQIVMPMVATTPVPVPATPAPAVSPAPAPAPAPAVAPAAASSIPMSSKVGKIMYDANQKPIAVMILDPDGKQEVVPLNPE